MPPTFRVSDTALFATTSVARIASTHDNSTAEFRFRSVLCTYLLGAGGAFLPAVTDRANLLCHDLDSSNRYLVKTGGKAVSLGAPIPPLLLPARRHQSLPVGIARGEVGVWAMRHNTNFTGIGVDKDGVTG